MKSNSRQQSYFRIKCISVIACGLLLSIISSCESFLDVDLSKSKVDAALVFSDDATATSAITGIYHDMINGGPNFANGSWQSVVSLAGLSADELFVFDRNNIPLIEFEQNILEAENSYVLGLWGSMYKTIYQSNAVIEGLANSATLSFGVKNQLNGEALFIRAFCHFYLTNLFGDVPLVTKTDYRLNSAASRVTEAEIYNQIIEDLINAQSLLDEDYVQSDQFSPVERVRPNKAAATALLSRVYLYTENWEAAEEQATTVIENTALYGLVDDLNMVFLANSNEAIWQLKPVAPGYNTLEGADFIVTAFPQYSVLNDPLIAAFEDGDERKPKWLGGFDTGNEIVYYPFKYKVQQGGVITEYSMVLRLAEQYLIRAEARSHQNNVGGALEDLSKIRNRAGLPDSPASDQASLLLAIEHERQVELFTEWGHRWFDLKRTDRADAVLGLVKVGWTSSSVWYPVPQSELNKNPNL